MKLIIIIILLFLNQSYIKCQNEECNRKQSRQAQYIIEKYIIKRAIKVGYKLTDKCPLNPKYNIFGWQEKHKIIFKNLWKCKFCKKTFKNEEYLDKHMNRRHETEVGPEATTCFANFCPILNCKMIHLEDHNFDSSLNTNEYFLHICDPREGEELRNKCDAVIRMCFPPSSGKEAQYLFQYFTRYLCESHLCTDETVMLLKELPLKDESITLLAYIYAIVILVAVIPMIIWNFYSGYVKTQNHGHID